MKGELELHWVLKFDLHCNLCKIKGLQENGGFYNKLDISANHSSTPTWKVLRVSE